MLKTGGATLTSPKRPVKTRFLLNAGGKLGANISHHAPGNSHRAFIWPDAGTVGDVHFDIIGDDFANNGKIAVRHFQNLGAVIPTRTLHVGTLAKSSIHKSTLSLFRNFKMCGSPHVVSHGFCQCQTVKQRKNILGPIIRELREQQALTQAAFAVKLNVLGWDVSRDIIARIEGQVRWVADFEIVKLAAGLKIDAPELLRRAIDRTPKIPRS
jgi:hypothetical protein